MDNQAIKEVLNELFSHLERLETQSEAILQFLKEKKRVTLQKLHSKLLVFQEFGILSWQLFA